MMNDNDPILLFDGVCNLCSSSVQFVLKHNKKGNVRFASLQSDFAKQQLEAFDLPSDYLQSLVLLENGNVFVKSDAALMLSKHLNGIWRIGSIFLIVPHFARNAVYDFIAKYRYNWFGKSETCWIPKPEWKARFLG